MNILLFSWLTILVAGTLLFDKTTDFGAIQIRLTTTSGFISENSGNTFSVANPGYSSVSSLGLALCGYDFPVASKVQFRAQGSYDSSNNVFVVIILPMNGTSFYFINYYLLVTTQPAASYFAIQNVCKQQLTQQVPYPGLQPQVDITNSALYNRSYTYNLTSPLLSNSSSGLVGLPFLCSLSSIALFGNFNFYNVTSISFPTPTLAQVTVVISYSAVYEVCLSILYYDQAIGLKANSFLNTSYALNLRVVSSISEVTLPSVSANNFSMPSIYGPTFSPKCVVGLSGVLWSTLARQTLNFNTTGLGIYDLVSSSVYNISYNFMCVSNIICSSTALQYYPLINQCEPVCTITNCSSCSTSTSCLTCDPGYYVNTLYRCSSCIPFCKTCLSATTCTACLDVYYYSSSTVQCIQCPQYCLVCANGYCSSCQSGYIPSGSQCLKCSTLIPLCLLCSSAAYCSSCPTGTYFANIYSGCLPCNGSLVGCSSCGSAYICYVCQWGYYLSYSRCLQCTVAVASCCPYFVANCVTCKDASTCSACIVGYYLNGAACANCSLLLPYCSSCSNGTTCTACQDSYYLLGTICTSCASYMPQCLTCSNLTYCLFCSSPYLAVGGSCYLCPQWPLGELYFLDGNNVCHSCSEVTASCTRCTSATACTLCLDLYYLSSPSTCASCALAMPNCLSCKTSSSCSICVSGYYPSLSSPAVCLQCNSSIVHCLSCSSLYYTVINSYVLTCSVCQPEYYLNATLCSSCSEVIPFCLTCQNSYQCVSCDYGYYLSSVLSCVSCIEVMPGCQLCTSGSLCSQCTEGYYLINNYCTLCNMALNHCYHCQYTDNTTLFCSTCEEGYYLGADYVCRACSAALNLCTKCSDSQVCLACITGYTPDIGGTCSQCSVVVPNCDYCTLQLSCRKCQANYLLDQLGDCRSCSSYLSGCLSCAYATNTANLTQLNCTNCSDGYLIFPVAPVFYQCIACNVTIPYCLTCIDLTKCKVCSNVSFVNEQYQCSLCSIYLQGCLYCTNSSECGTCSSGHYLALGKCLVCDTTQFGVTTVLNQSVCLSCYYSDNTATCSSCLSTYYLSSNNCSLCSQAMPNCLICTSAVLCTQCVSGYYLSTYSTTCIQCDPSLAYCTSCNANRICLACQESYYLDGSNNVCVRCSKIDANCKSCVKDANGVVACNSCSDGYYLDVTVCRRCQDAMNECVLCSSASNCLVTSSAPSSSSSSTLFLVLAIFCFLLATVIAVYLCWKRRNSEDSTLPKKGELTSQTQRELISDNLMKSDSSDDKTVKITQKMCHYCNRAKFQTMNIELLCLECAGKVDRGEGHKITNSKKGGRRQSQMRESLATEDNAEFQPPPSQIKPPSQVATEKKGLKDSDGPIGRGEHLIDVPKSSQSMRERTRTVDRSRSHKGILVTSLKGNPAEK